MVQRTGVGFAANEKAFPIGGTVLANQDTGWYGLRGRIKGTRSLCRNGDMETLVCCDFELPDSHGMRERLKRNFEQAYGRKRPLEEIPLKDVFLQAGSLEPVANALPEPVGQLYVLTAHEMDGGHTCPLAVSSSRDYLLRKMEENLESQRKRYQIADAQIQLKEVTFLAEEGFWQFCYGYENQPLDGRELRYMVSRVPYFSRKEVAA